MPQSRLRPKDDFKRTMLKAFGVTREPGLAGSGGSHLFNNESSMTSASASGRPPTRSPFWKKSPARSA